MKYDQLMTELIEEYGCNDYTEAVYHLVTNWASETLDDPFEKKPCSIVVRKVKIRLATTEDIDRITEMHQSYIQSWHPREYFERLIAVEEPLVLVAEQAGKIVDTRLAEPNGN